MENDTVVYAFEAACALSVVLGGSSVLAHHCSRRCFPSALFSTLHVRNLALSASYAYENYI